MHYYTVQTILRWVLILLINNKYILAQGLISSYIDYQWVGYMGVEEHSSGYNFLLSPIHPPYIGEYEIVLDNLQ